MNQVQTLAQFVVAPMGKSATDRKAHAVSITTSQCALAAIAATGGKVGKAAGARLAQASHVDIVNHCANSNYRPLAEYLSALTGDTIVLDRHVFHALPAIWQGKVQTLINAGKEFSSSGKPTPAIGLARHVAAYCTELVKASEAIRAEREAEAHAKARDAEIAELLAISDETEEALAA